MEELTIMIGGVDVKIADVHLTPELELIRSKYIPQTATGWRPRKRAGDGFPVPRSKKLNVLPGKQVAVFIANHSVEPPVKPVKPVKRVTFVGIPETDEGIANIEDNELCVMFQELVPPSPEKETNAILCDLLADLLVTVYGDAVSEAIVIGDGDDEFATEL